MYGNPSLDLHNLQLQQPASVLELLKLSYQSPEYTRLSFSHLLLQLSDADLSFRFVGP